MSWSLPPEVESLLARSPIDPVLVAIGVIALLAFLWVGALLSRARLRRAAAAERSDADRRFAEVDARLREEERQLALSEAACTERDGKIEDLFARLAELRAEARAERDVIAARLDSESEARRAAAVEAAKLRADGEAAERRIADLRAAEEAMANRFKALSEEVLTHQGARQRAESDAALKALLGPMKAGVDKFQEELRAAHRAAAGERITLTEQIKGLAAQTNAVNDQAAALTNALRSDKQKQGAWGEAQLARLLEAAHLQDGVHFETQSSARDEDGRLLRPDVVVNMPGERPLVIDSKVSLIAYETAVNADDEAGRGAALAMHCRAIRAHVDTLAEKSYHRLDKGGVDYVVMFVPIESALSMAVEAQPDLSAWALEKGVALATPLTLMALLRTVEHVWAVDARQKNAMEIADRAGRLYDKVAGFVEDMEKVGRALDTATKAQGDAMKKLSEGRGNVLAQTDMLKQLGAKAQKAIEAEFDAEEARVLPAAE